MCIHLEQNVCAHSLAMSNNGLLVLSFSIPAIQLYTSGSKERAWNTNYWKCGIENKPNSMVFLHKPNIYIAILTELPLSYRPRGTHTCIQTAAPDDTSPRMTFLQTDAQSGRCCGRSWWSNEPAAGPSPGRAPAGPRKRVRFHQTSNIYKSHH